LRRQDELLAQRCLEAWLHLPLRSHADIGTRPRPSYLPSMAGQRRRRRLRPGLPWPVGQDAADALWAPAGRVLHLQAEGVPQVDATHVRIGQQRVRSPLREHAAFAEDIRPVANAQGLADVVVGDQHADAAVLEVADDALDLADRD